MLERPRPKRDQRPPSPELRWPPLSRTHKVLFGVTIAVYLVIIVAVLTTSPLVHFDWYLMMSKPYERFPHLYDLLNYFVITGQRGPSAIVAFLWLFWRAWRTRSWRPPLVMAVALLLLNMSVGAVKIGIGRLGPHYAHVMGSAELFQGGDIFPSGHTANAVVTWGVLAYLAVRFRRTGHAVAAFMGISVGLDTVYLGTHWFSDVIAGWAAGFLIMLALPLFEPIVGSTDLRMQDWWTHRREQWTARRSARSGVRTTPVPVPAPATAADSADWAAFVHSGAVPFAGPRTGGGQGGRGQQNGSARRPAEHRERGTGQRPPGAPRRVLPRVPSPAPGRDHREHLGHQ